jgi:hypothetical protein
MKLDPPGTAVNLRRGAPRGGPDSPAKCPGFVASHASPGPLPNNTLQRLKEWSVPFGHELAVFEPEPLLGPLQAGFRSIR